MSLLNALISYCSDWSKVNWFCKYQSPTPQIFNFSNQYNVVVSRKGCRLIIPEVISLTHSIFGSQPNRYLLLPTGNSCWMKLDSLCALACNFSKKVINIGETSHGVGKKEIVFRIGTIMSQKASSGSLNTLHYRDAEHLSLETVPVQLLNVVTLVKYRSLLIPFVHRLISEFCCRSWSMQIMQYNQ